MLARLLVIVELISMLHHQRRSHSPALDTGVCYVKSSQTLVGRLLLKAQLLYKSTIADMIYLAYTSPGVVLQCMALSMVTGRRNTSI